MSDATRDCYFLNPSKYNQGSFYKKIGEDRVEVTPLADNTLAFEVNGTKDVLQQRTGEYGPYYIGTYSGEKVVLSQISTKFGPCVKLKILPPREEDEGVDAGTEAPATYGTRS